MSDERPTDKPRFRVLNPDASIDQILFLDACESERELGNTNAEVP